LAIVAGLLRIAQFTLAAVAVFSAIRFYYFVSRIFYFCFFIFVCAKNGKTKHTSL